MKISKIVLGLVLIVAAVLLILEALGIILPITGRVGEIGFWQAVGGILLICGIGSLLMSGKFWEIFVPLGFLFMIFEKNFSLSLSLICIDADSDHVILKMLNKVIQILENLLEAE